MGDYMSFQFLLVLDIHEPTASYGEITYRTDFSNKVSIMDAMALVPINYNKADCREKSAFRYA